MRSRSEKLSEIRWVSKDICYSYSRTSGENISLDYNGPALNGTLNFYENSISVTINESEFNYMIQYDMKIENPAIEALGLKRAIYFQGGHIFENKDWPEVKAEMSQIRDWIGLRSFRVWME